MFTRLKNWLNDKSSSGESTSADQLTKTGTYVAVQPAKNAKSGAAHTDNSDEKPVGRHTYIREETGTHETLKILDDSLVDPDEETGIDPYNTGGFDRSKNWNNSFRK
jgi:hypothetical protein